MNLRQINENGTKMLFLVDLLLGAGFREIPNSCYRSLSRNFGKYRILALALRAGFLLVAGFREIPNSTFDIIPAISGNGESF